MSCRVKQGLLQLFPVTDSIYRYSSIYVAVDDGYWEFFKTSKNSTIEKRCTQLMICIIYKCRNVVNKTLMLYSIIHIALPSWACQVLVKRQQIPSAG